MGARLVQRLRRRLLEQWIECAIALLDEIDGDPDFEPEPSEDEGLNALSQQVPSTLRAARVVTVHARSAGSATL